MEINKIIQGDCLVEMRKMKENSVDTIITDPPYGLGFMGKEWDTFNPEYIDKAMAKDKRKHTQIASQRRSNTAGTYDFSLKGKEGFQKWMTEIAKEMLRVTKPGGTLLIFGGTRTYHRMACAIEDAGWILKDCIMWLYGSGFPKATDISKQLDKKAGKERKKIGESRIGKSSLGENSDWDTSDKMKEIKASGKVDITEPATPEAKLWNGWKSHGLKPAYEPILVAMKSNEGTYAQNALKWGVSGLNIDGGRIGMSEVDFDKYKEKRRSFKSADGKIPSKDYETRVPFLASPSYTAEEKIQRATKGRFPANIILDKEAAKILDEQSGELKSGDVVPNKYKHKGWACSSKINTGSWKGDKGGASRFFKVIK